MSELGDALARAQEETDRRLADQVERSRRALDVVSRRPEAAATDKDFEYLFKKADDLCRDGNIDGAVALYTDLIESNPRLPLAYLRRGACSVSRRRFRRRDRRLRQGNPAPPNDPRPTW